MTNFRHFLRTSVFLCGALIVTLASPLFVQGAESGKYLFYVGTYTQEKGSTSKGIYAYRYDESSGQITSLGLAAAADNPSFLAIHPNGKFLYAVNEVSDFKGPNNGGVSAFSIDHATGKLTLLNEVPTRGADPCYLVVDRVGKFVFVANYTGGSVAVLPLREDGRVGEVVGFDQYSGHGVNPARQEAPHPHSFSPSPDDRFAFADDLGLDKLLSYKFDASSGKITPNDPPYIKLDPGSGPRHLVLHPSGKFAYVIGEIDSSVTALSVDLSKGTFHRLQTLSTLPKDFKAEDEEAEIHIHPSGKFLYTSNRGHNSIAVFAIDQEKGTLTPVEYHPTEGRIPRDFELDPHGKFLFAENEKSNNIVVFRIDEKTGKLAPTGQILNVSEPVSLKFVPE